MEESISKVLLVEDDKQYRFIMRELLVNAGYIVKSMEDPIMALEEISKERYDLAVCDLRMEPVNGIRLSKSLKKIYPRIKTLILTGDPDDETEIASLDGMIDGYLSKDKSAKVILKYVQSLLKKESLGVEKKQLVSQKEELVIDTKSHTVYKSGKPILLTNKEYNLLNLFLTHVNEPLSREYIQGEIWGNPNEFVEDEGVNLRAIDVLVKRLREKLQVYSILSLRGFGYKWQEY